MKTRLLCVAAAAGAALLATPAHATSITYGFNCITTGPNCPTGEAQFSMTVTDDGVSAGEVEFLFNNSGPLASAITQIYFDDDADVLASFIASPFTYSNAGISYATFQPPPNLPAGSSISPAFDTTGGLRAGPTSPVAPNGVHPGEWVGITLNLQAGSSFGDVIAALNDESLRVGLHAQAFADGGSESFVNGPGPGTPVPEPGTLLLLGGAISGLAGLRRRRRA